MADANTLTAQARALWGQVQTLFSGMGYSTTLTSAGRSASYNSTIPGASSTSQHIGGNAFDFQVRDTGGQLVDPLAVQATLATQGLSYGQNIAEYGRGMNPRNHLSIPTATLQGQNKVTYGGAYQTNVIDKSKALTQSTFERAMKTIDGAFNKFGIQGPYEGITGDIDKVVGAVNDPLGTAAASSLGPWLMRGSLAIVGILLLAAAIFVIANGSKGDILKAALK